MYKSDLEILVDNDMIAMGFNPNSEEAVRKYWEWYFNGH